MTGIVTLSLVPLRQSANERSEMTSQLLFGELVEIQEETARWFFVRNYSDNYRGWVDRKMIKTLNEIELELIQNSPALRIAVPLSVCKKTTTNESLYLPGGSILSAINDNECIVDEENFLVEQRDIYHQNNTEVPRIVELATQYLNAPYLWGGKSILGIDCSGLVQVVFAICGIQLPRDASQQVDEGRVIDFLSETKPGDLVFFENEEGSIIHVGILINSHQIIHASGWVKVEQIDSQGIISKKTGEYSHKLRVIKRLT